MSALLGARYGLLPADQQPENSVADLDVKPIEFFKRLVKILEIKLHHALNQRHRFVQHANR